MPQLVFESLTFFLPLTQSGQGYGFRVSPTRIFSLPVLVTVWPPLTLSLHGSNCRYSRRTFPSSCSCVCIPDIYALSYIMPAMYFAVPFQDFDCDGVRSWGKALLRDISCVCGDDFTMLVALWVREKNFSHVKISLHTILSFCCFLRRSSSNFSEKYLVVVTCDFIHVSGFFIHRTSKYSPSASQYFDIAHFYTFCPSSSSICVAWWYFPDDKNTTCVQKNISCTRDLSVVNSVGAFVVVAWLYIRLHIFLGGAPPTLV